MQYRTNPLKHGHLSDELSLSQPFQPSDSVSVLGQPTAKEVSQSVQDGAPQL